MRALVLLFAALAVSACAGLDLDADPRRNPPVIKAQMPLRILRDEGQPPRMGQAELRAGGYADTSLFDISFDFNSEGAVLGTPKGVGMTVRFGAYCRDRPSWVESVLTAPSGQSWSGHRVWVPAGPDRGQDWSSGYIDTPEVIQAVAAGGRFTLALQDDEGQRWHEVVIDTLTPARRQRMFADNLAAFRATDPATVPAASDMLRVVRREAPSLPSPPRPCPTPATP